MSSFRKLVAWALSHELNPENIRAQLSASAVPVTAADCRTCANPCEDGHEDYPARFTVDMETQMLGSVSSFRRQIFISTGKTDWGLEITWTSGSLASYISGTHCKNPAPPSIQSPSLPTTERRKLAPVPGVFDASHSKGLAILNANHKTICEENNLETVLVFPDFVIIAGVPSSREGAQALWDTALDPNLPRILGSQDSAFSTWVMPYACVVTFCSHKRIDGRCGISAPILERAFTDSLERRGWAVDTQLEHILDPPLEKFQGTAEEKAAHVMQTLKALQTAKKALILYNSHMGGHKYAGNCLIYTPNGTSVWYGRVTPHEVESIVENTIEGGLVLPPLLRGGVNLSKPGCSTLHDW